MGPAIARHCGVESRSDNSGKVMSRCCFALLLALCAALPAQAVDTFLAPAVPLGQIDVRLRPTEAVLPNVAKLVTFGVPFPRASMSAAGLVTLRVWKGGVEIPAHVEQLTPWRHRSNAGI